MGRKPSKLNVGTRIEPERLLLSPSSRSVCCQPRQHHQGLRMPQKDTVQIIGCNIRASTKTVLLSLPIRRL